MDQPFVLSTLFVLGLLLVGFVLRAGLKPLRVLFVPASVVGGLVGLVLMQLAIRQDASPATADVAGEIGSVIGGWPGLLIAVVFAGLLMERPGKSFKQGIRAAGRQGIMVYVIGLGEAFFGILACALLITPFYPEIPKAFGQMIETGFIGGHGTAAAMGNIYRDIFDFEAGRDIAFLFATVGLVYGVVSGILFVNIGVRRGWIRRRSGSDDPGRRSGSFGSDGAATPGSEASASASLPIPVVSGLEDRHDPKPSAYARVRSDVIDPLAFQLCILGLAFFVGYVLQQGFLATAGAVAPGEWYQYIGKIPLFLFTLLGGWLTREGMHLVGFGDLIDGPSLNRITALAMELLIVAALATLRIEAAADYFWPIVVLLLTGFAWTAVCLLVIARLILPRDYWFELGLMNYGMSTATTAQGILLLRIVDRDLDSGAAEDYAAAAPLSAPFIGGGVITLLATPLALASFGYVPVLVVMGLVLAGFLGLGYALRDRDDQLGRGAT